MAIGIEEFMKIATPEQRQLLFDLYDLAEKEQELSEKVNRVYSSRNTGTYSNGVSITVCEDEDDAAIISVETRKELERVRTQIVELLKRAVNELEIGDVGIIQRQYKNYVTDNGRKLEIYNRI